MISLSFIDYMKELQTTGTLYREFEFVIESNYFEVIFTGGNNSYFLMSVGSLQ